MDTRPRTKTAVVVLAAVSLSGCSFALVKGPPTNPQAAPTVCTTSKAVPVLDGLGGAFSLVLGVMFVETGDPQPPGEIPGGFGGTDNKAAAIAGGIGAVQFLSAYYGGRKVEACREYLLQAIRPDTTLAKKTRQGPYGRSERRGRPGRLVRQ